MTLNEIHKKMENIQRDITQNRFLYSEDKIKFNGELIIVVEELKLYKEALNIACDRLGWLEHDCKGCALEVCENYVNDKKYRELIEETCLRRAKECSELIEEACLQKAREELNNEK